MHILAFKHTDKELLPLFVYAENPELKEFKCNFLENVPVMLVWSWQHTKFDFMVWQSKS